MHNICYTPIICSEGLKVGVRVNEQPYWSKMIPDVLSGRVEKPRISGLTMIIDVGQPITYMRDLFELAASHIDFWKFGFGSVAVCPPERVLDKITLCQEYDILAYPGGTTLEIVAQTGDWRCYMRALWESGVRAIEISDGTIFLALSKRREMIREAKKLGFVVLTEVGKKARNSSISLEEQAQIILGDISSGASYIIVEGREAGIGIGVYDETGEVKASDVQRLVDLVGPYQTRLIWEAPLTKQQAFYLKQFGNHINFGNIRPNDVIALESLRRGLRSETLEFALGKHVLPSQVTAKSEETDSSPLNVRGEVNRDMLPKLWTGNQQNHQKRS